MRLSFHNLWIKRIQLRKSGSLPPYQLGGLCTISITLQPHWNSRVRLCGVIWWGAVPWLGGDGNLLGTSSLVNVTMFSSSKMLVPFSSLLFGTRILGIDIKSRPEVQKSHRYFTYYINFELFFSLYL